MTEKGVQMKLDFDQRLNIDISGKPIGTLRHGTDVLDDLAARARVGNASYHYCPPGTRYPLSPGEREVPPGLRRPEWHMDRLLEGLASFMVRLDTPIIDVPDYFIPQKSAVGWNYGGYQPKGSRVMFSSMRVFVAYVPHVTSPWVLVKVPMAVCDKYGNPAEYYPEDARPAVMAPSTMKNVDGALRIAASFRNGVWGKPDYIRGK